MIEIKCIDNLKLMAEIPDSTIDLIYCDILYGTGRKFKDYQDLKPKRKIIEEHYIPRIKEMYRILKDTGSIYLQMDYRISHWIRCIMDDVFKYENFVQVIYWKYNAGGKYNDKFKTVTDEILFYGKTKKRKFYPERVTIPHHPDTYRRIKGYANAGITININGKQRENLWDFNAVKKGNYTKINKEWVDYETQKPEALIKTIIEASSNSGDLVADFYAGSFTTAKVCKDLNRHFIGCDINQKAYEIGLKRVGKNF